MTVTAVELGPAWDRLHEQPRFRPLYPNESVVRFVARHFGDDRRHRILDVGSGAGRHCVLGLDHGNEMVGSDLSIEGLRATAARMGDRGQAPRVAGARFEALPFADATFAGVICWGVLNYADAAGFQTGVDEIRRVLEPGGRALIVTRTTDDHRCGAGARIEDATYLLATDDTNEEGMLMHFLDRSAIDRVFAAFSEVVVDRHDHTAGGGAIQNSDWIIEVTK